MKIILNDQTEITNATVGKTQNYLELIMGKKDAISNIGKFMDPGVMSKIEYYSGAWKTVYSGYDCFVNMESPKSEDEMRVWMEGNENSSVSDPIPLFDDMYMPKGVQDQNG